MKKQINYWQKFEEYGYYHIYNRGNNKENLFLSDNNYSYFLYKWNYYISPFAKTIAYCLMPNHFHFLIQIKPADALIKSIAKNLKTNQSEKYLGGLVDYNTFLEDQFKRLFSSYAMSFNKQQKRTGSLFQKRFKRIIINDENKLLHILSYIHHNPIHHGLSNSFEDWRFSSYNSFFDGKTQDKNLTLIQNILGPNLQKAMQSFKEYHTLFKHQKKINSIYLEKNR